MPGHQGEDTSEQLGGLVIWQILAAGLGVKPPGSGRVFLTDDGRDPGRQPVGACAARPPGHLPISWRPEEQLPKEVQIQIADTLMADLGLSEHQQLIVAHDDGRCSSHQVLLDILFSNFVWEGSIALP